MTLPSQAEMLWLRLALALVLLALTVRPTIAYNNGVGRQPPMVSFKFFPYMYQMYSTKC